MMATRPGRRRQRRGAALVEFAFVVPLLFLLLLGILEYARFLFTVQLINNAAREGARYAIVNTKTLTTTDIQNYVDQYLAGQGAAQLQSYSPSANIAVFQADPVTGKDNGQPWQNGGRSNPIGVSVSGTYNPIMPGLLFLAGSISVQGTCIMEGEMN